MPDIGTIWIKADPETLRAIAECNERMAWLCAIMEKAEKGSAPAPSRSAPGPELWTMPLAAWLRVVGWRRRAVELLCKVQWAGSHPGGDSCCPVCGDSEGGEHNPGCELAALLRDDSLPAAPSTVPTNAYEHAVDQRQRAVKLLKAMHAGYYTEQAGCSRHCFFTGYDKCPVPALIGEVGE